MPKVTEYNEITSISGSSAYIYVVDISGGSPAYGKISGSNLGVVTSGCVFYNPMTTKGDMIWRSNRTDEITRNTDRSGAKVINASDSTIERVIADCTLTAVSFTGSVNVIANIWISQNMVGTPKPITVSLRRDSVSGDLLDSVSLSMTIDSIEGHNRQFQINFLDSNPTTGIYVLTSKSTGGNTADIYSDTREFDLDYDTLPIIIDRLGIGSDGNILVSTTASPTWTTLSSLITSSSPITTISASSILLYIVDTSGGSPAYGKISGSNLGSAISASSSGSGPIALDDLTNVSASAPNNGNVLSWNASSGSWVASVPVAGSSLTLDDLTNVNVPTPGDGNVLSWNSATGSWVASEPVSGSGAAMDILMLQVFS